MSVKEDALKEQLPLMGVDKWVNNNYTNYPINVWNIEPNSGHGANTGQIVKDVNPNANVFWGPICLITKGDKVVSLSVVDPLGETFTGTDALAKFVEKHSINIITSSQAGYNDCAEWQQLCKDLVDKYNVVICQCAGNDGYSEDEDTSNPKFPTEISHVIAALNYVKYGKNKNKIIERAGYSSVGEDVDFAQLVLWWIGTSAATPAFAGQLSMIMQRYGTMSLQESNQYLKMICKDMETEGHDRLTGWGMPVLPDWDKKYITMTTKSKEYFVDGIKKTMDTLPVNKNGRVFVPIRVIAESLGCSVDWDMNKDKSITVTIGKGNIVIKLTTGSELAYIDGKKSYLDEAPFIDGNNRTLVPIRFIAEALNCKVDWIQKEAKVQILEQ